METGQFTEPLARKLADNENELEFEDAQLTADRLIKCALAARKEQIKTLQSKLHLLRNKFEAVLSKSVLCTSAEENSCCLTGVSLHTSSSEPLFVEPTYKVFSDCAFAIEVGIDRKC